jgi:hypothetical protein
MTMKFSIFFLPPTAIYEGVGAQKTITRFLGRIVIVRSGHW